MKNYLIKLKKIEYNCFAQKLIKRVPELKDLYENHLRYYDEELLHIFMEDIFRFVKENIANEPQKWILRLIKFLDEAIKSSDIKVQELICFSFLDDLMFPSNDNKLIIKIRSLLSPDLKKELKKLEDWKPSFSQSSIKKLKTEGKSKNK